MRICLIAQVVSLALLQAVTLEGIESLDWGIRRISKRSSDDSLNWALDRINERQTLGDSKIDKVAPVDIYVVGGGVRGSHSEFSSRVREGWSWDGSDSRVDCSSEYVSTGAASIAGGSHIGISRHSTIVPVKIACGNSASSSEMSAGLKWVRAQIASFPTHRSVVLLAFPMISVVSELDQIAENYLVVLPAGDHGSDNCYNFKSLVEVGIVTVASSTSDDSQSLTSNYGICVDIFAPGDKVRVAGGNDDTSLTTNSGTVFAAAGVAGVAAKTLFEQREAGKVEILKGILLGHATKGVLSITDAAIKAGTPNKLIFDVCPYYKLPDQGKCYVAQTKQQTEKDISENGRLTKAAKSVVTFDNMAYNYYLDCLSVLLFASSETSTRVEATHSRDGLELKSAVFTIHTDTHTITLSSGPIVAIDDKIVDLSVSAHSSDTDYFFIAREDVEVRSQKEGERFIPVVTVMLPNNVTVSFDGHQEVRIEVDTDLFNEKTEGLCGFLDNSHVREFVDKQGNDIGFTFDHNKNKFVDEWTTNIEDCDEEAEELCERETQCQVTAEEVCYPLKDITGEFSKCFEMLDPSSWYTNCVDAVTQCCCNNVDTTVCACEEQKKYWWAAMLEGCSAALPCDTTCKKELTDEECLDNAGIMGEFFYKDAIQYTPIDGCHYVDTHDKTICNHDGTWDSKPSDCKVKTCGAPGITDLAEYKSDPFDSYNCGEKVEYECTKTACDCNCYSMSGEGTTQCVTDGERTADWSNPPPTCSLNHCEKPQDPAVDKRINSNSPLSWVVDKDTMNTDCCAGRASFACNECYDLIGESTLSCCNNKWGNGSLPTCKLRECVDPTLEVTSSEDPHLVVTFSNQHCSTVATYSCDNSCFEISGASNRTCTPEGSWSEELPRCVKKKCPTLDSYDDGVYMVEGNPLMAGNELECGDTVDVRCDKCNWPCTSTCHRTCKWDSDNELTVWSNDVPQCQPFLCRQRDVPNAKISKKRGALECGESSAATCNTCYKQISGDNTRTCTAPLTNQTCPISDVDGVYSGEEIRCVKMECEELVLGENIRIKDKTCSNEFGCDCMVTFECESECYEMVGEPVVQCRGFGWDHDVPVCSRKTCPFVQPDFSRKYNYDIEWKGGCQYTKDGARAVSADMFFCGDVLEVEAANAPCYHVCNKDALLCQPDGSWNVTETYLPSCMYMECKQPDPILNAHIVADPKEYNCTTTIRYECDSCYQHISGDLERSCIAEDISSSPDGMWTGEPPLCEKMGCAKEDIPVLANATHDITDIGMECGGKATYECDECSVLEGDNTNMCTPVSISLAGWTSTPPTCQPICCPDLPVHESLDADYVATATHARFMYGAHVAKCGDNYVCQQVEAKCDECFEYKSPGSAEEYAPVRTCMRDDDNESFWSNSDKVCTRKECAVPDIPEANHAHYTDFAGSKKCNQTLEVQCDCCHKIDDTTIASSVQCLPTKLWDSPIPVCSPISCQIPPIIDNGNFNLHSSSDACTCGSVTYQCDPCYRLVGASTLNCLQDAGQGTASWSSAPPVCEPICCEPLEEPVDAVTGEISTSLQHKHPAREMLLSYEEISIKEHYTNCQQDFVCQEIDPICGSCFEYTEDDGNLRAGTSQPPTRQCIKNLVDGHLLGEWTNKDKHCSLKHCPYREIPPELHLHYASPGYSASNPTHCLASVEVECDECYEMMGGERTASLLCKQDKKWSGELPTCVRSACAAPPAVPHCSYTAGEDLCGESRHLTCDSCFFDSSCRTPEIQESVMEAQCTYNKTWSWLERAPEMSIRTCDIASEIEHGSVHTTGNSCGDMAKYTCDRCHAFKEKDDCLCKRRKCIPDPTDCTKGMWNGTTPTCEKITCPNLPPAPSNGKLVGVDDTCDGSAVYSCDEGYYLTDGDLVRNCTEYGTWSGKHPICSIKRCTEIGSSPYRTHFPVASTYGTVVTFTCEDCFQFTSEFTDESIKEEESIFPRFHVLKCEATGNWNGSAPVCQERRCGNPGAISNGRMVGDVDLGCGATVTYSCNEGYMFTAGSARSRTCTEGLWTGSAPVCEAIDCGDPAVGAPLFAESIDTIYGYEATFKCGKNARAGRCYEDPVPEETQCGADGFWEAVPTSCTRLECPPLPEFKHATLDMAYKQRSAQDCGQQVRVICDSGYKLSSSPWVRCSGTRWFPSRMPECEKRRCTQQQEPNNGVVTPNFAEQRKKGVFYEDKLTYECEECYKLNGVKTRKCISDHKGVSWSAVEPVCDRIMCSLPLILNGGTSVPYTETERPQCGKTVQFECDRGYRLVGSESAECTRSGAWDSVLPTCEEVLCDAPPRRDNMEVLTYPPVSGTVYTPGVALDFNCVDGWNLEGYESIFCENDGTWSSEVPNCVPDTCDEGVFEAVTHARIARINDITREISCDTCYAPSDSSATLLKCNKGQWTPPRPSLCQITRCGNPGQPENGKLETHISHYECGISVSFVCVAGYELSGKSSLTCTEEGAWDGRTPVCIEQSCPSLDEVENAITTPSNNGRTVHYECHEGYELYGDAVRQCYNGTQWSGPGPSSCKVKHCGKVGDILFGTVQRLRAGLEGQDDTPGAAVRYTCTDNRYQLIGEDERACGNDKKWSFAPPECKCVACPILSLDNGRIETADENKVGTSVQYVCDPGYKLVPEGSSTRRCQESGEWSESTPVCSKISCPGSALKIPEGGRLESDRKAAFSFLEEVQVVCEEWGNKLVYSCGNHGTWEGDVGKTCGTCRQVRKDVITYINKKIPGVCVLGQCSKETTVRIPVTSSTTEIVCE